MLEDEIQLIKQKNREMKKAYLSTLSTKYNPDILVGNAMVKGIQFIRGNEYFSKNEKDGDGAGKINESELSQTGGEDNVYSSKANQNKVENSKNN